MIQKVGDMPDWLNNVTSQRVEYWAEHKIDPNWNEWNDEREESYHGEYMEEQEDQEMHSHDVAEEVKATLMNLLQDANVDEFKIALSQVPEISGAFIWDVAYSLQSLHDSINPQLSFIRTPIQEMVNSIKGNA